LPYIVTVAPGEEGIWEIDFMSLGDGTNHADGEIYIGIVNSNVSDVNFGVQQAPIADDKYFIVGASDFDVEPIKSGFAPIEDYLNIPMSSSAMTG